MLKKPLQNLRRHFVLVAASLAAAEEKLVSRKLRDRPPETGPRLYAMQIAERRGFDDCRHITGFPGNVGKFAESLELIDRITQKVFIFDDKHLRIMRVLEPGVDVLCPMAGIKRRLGRHKSQKIKH